MLTNYNNYGPYVQLTKGEKMIINVDDINEKNWNLHFNSILNILKDGIETDLIQNSFIQVNFSDGVIIDLSIFDYFTNIIMWRSIISVKSKIESKHIFFDINTTANTIKNYIDTHIVIPYRGIIDNRTLNNIISDTIYAFTYIDDFSLYLANTINLEDDIQLMQSNKEAWDIYHLSLENVPLEEVKRVGMEKTMRLIEIIKNSEFHCLADFFKAREGINAKQYREFAVNIGTKPDGNGGIFPIVIDSSFIRGGLTDISSIFIESRAGRTAQILSKTNVGDSGHFARLLGLNNSDTILHRDPNFVCDSTNFQIVTIENHRMLNMLVNRYYRLNPRGMEYVITPKDKHLIGTTIYLRSPMTCSSKSYGDGVCYRCYGKLAHTNNNINIGKLAAELLSSILTQMLLSAKHLLEPLIKKIEWSIGYHKFFTMDANIIYLQDELELKGYKLVIDPDNIQLENEHDDFEYNEFVTEYEIVDKAGHSYKVYSSEDDEMYISGELNDIIRDTAIPVDGKISIDLNTLKEVPLFLVKIHNNELSRTLNKLKDVINKNKVTKSFDRHGLLQEFLNVVIEGNINITSVHCEVLLSNQLRSTYDILQEPDWSIPNINCEVLTLNGALTDNPSIIVAMSYQRLSKVLYNPLSFSRNNPSFMDLFFSVSPQLYLKDSFEGRMK